MTLADITERWDRITRALIDIVDQVAMTSRPAIAWARPGGELVTDLELRIDIELRTAVARLAPALPVLSEEMGRLDPARMTSEPTLVAVLDPIDGTRSLVERNDAWHCSLAICERGKPKLGIVYQPIRGTVYDSARTKPARTPANGGVVVLSASAIRGAPELVARLEGARLQPRPVAHAVEKIVSVLDGRADAAIAPARTSHPFYAWDIAAATVIGEAHGLILRTASGAPLDLGDLQHPLYTGWICARDERAWAQVRRALEVPRRDA